MISENETRDTQVENDLVVRPVHPKHLAVALVAMINGIILCAWILAVVWPPGTCPATLCP